MCVYAVPKVRERDQFETLLLLLLLSSSLAPTANETLTTSPPVLLIAAHRIASPVKPTLLGKTQDPKLSLSQLKKKERKKKKKTDDRSGHRAGIYNVIGIIDALYSVTNYYTQDNKTRQDETRLSLIRLLHCLTKVHQYNCNHGCCNATLSVYIQTTTEEAEEKKKNPKGPNE